MRLPLLPPASLSPDQKDLYDDMVAVIEKNFGELVARRADGALIGRSTAGCTSRTSGSLPGLSTNRYGSTAFCLPRSTSWSSW
jgi:hypothetical protein